ncbi:inner membrane protein YhaI [Vibrio sp. 16]|nr:inner membrane protein YhaI [Vibrio sp. 16]
MISIAVRRLHDIEHSGWWGWVFLVPVIGPIWLIYLLAKPGVGLALEEAV